ncbi:MAG TPA: DNA topoisomerase IB [Caulobacteraceae bacterium]
MAKDVADGAAGAAGLKYVHDYDPGIRRTDGPEAPRFIGADGREVKHAATLERIRRLAVPPAWTQVWICPHANGHIQAVGRDARGRKQYRYHADWRSHQDEAKFERMAAFGRALPRLRKRVEADLAWRGMPRERVLAAVVRLLEVTLIRVGNDEYARTNKSFGLTTLRKRHVTLSGVGAVFEFRGKSGVTHRTQFHDRRLARILRGCEHLPGQRLFQYVDDSGARHAVESNDVNAYIREAMGEAFSAKDFRTWAGTLAAARALAMQPGAENAAHLKRTVAICVKAVAGLLGNTPTVCRACYIHPAVFSEYESGALSRKLAGATRAAELTLLKMLDEAAAG